MASLLARTRWTTRLSGLRRPHGHGYRTSTKISTLRPECLRSTDFLDFSGRTRKHPDLKAGGRIHLQYHYFKMKHLPAPPKTHGFLYYHTDPTLPPTAGEIRFRITSSNDPATFENGSDLVRPNSCLWTKPLYNIASATSPNVRNQLLADGLVTPELLWKCEQMVKHKKMKQLHMVRLYTLDQPFVADVSRSSIRCGVVGKDGVGRLTVFHLFAGGGPDHHRSCPYTGKVLIRFEHSPSPKHAGRDDVLVLRVLKVITPIEGEHHYLQKPTEGSLIQTIRSPRSIFIRQLRNGQPHPLNLLLPSHALGD